MGPRGRVKFSLCVFAPRDGAETSTLDLGPDCESSQPLTGGRSADPEPAGAEPAAASRADPEEVVPRGPPKETQQAAHPATVGRLLARTGASRLHLEPHLQLRLCRFCRPGPEQSSPSASASSQLPAQLAGQAEDGPAQPPGGAGATGGEAGQQLPGHSTGLNQSFKPHQMFLMQRHKICK